MNVVHTLIEHHFCFDLEIQSAGRLQSIWFNGIQDACIICIYPILRWSNDDDDPSLSPSLNQEQHTFIHKRKKRKINDSKGSSYVKIDKLVDLFELLSEWTSITIEKDYYDDRGI